MAYYERRLPHCDLIGVPIFVTFRLHGSLPAGRVFPPAGLRSGKAFVAMDRALDTATTGPMFLRIPDIAESVRKAIVDGDRRFGRYNVHSFVIMPNHVHLLVTPHVRTKDWSGPLKGYTGHEANRILGISGKPFWQDESYDHLVRNDREFDRITNYIEYNPVKAGLAATPQHWRWSSATRNP